MKWIKYRKSSSKPFLVLPKLLSPIKLPIRNSYFDEDYKNMSAGLRLITKNNQFEASTWPLKVEKRKHKSKVRKPRPRTATLDHPILLDIDLLDKIDMSLVRKELLSITNLCKPLIGRKFDTKRKGSALFAVEGMTSKSRRQSALRDSGGGGSQAVDAKNKRRDTLEKPDGNCWENENPSARTFKKHDTNRLNELSKPKFIRKFLTDSPIDKKILNVSEVSVKSPRVKMNDGSPVPSDSSLKLLRNNKSAEENTVVRKELASLNIKPKKSDAVSLRLSVPVSKKTPRELFAVPHVKQIIPEPCTSCGRSDKPERFHSHPVTNHNHEPSSAMNHPRTIKPRTSSVASSKTSKKSVVGKPQRGGTLAKGKQAMVGSTSERLTTVKHEGKQNTPRAATAGPKGPRFLTCYLCGRDFGSASLPLHEPKCLERWDRENALLPVRLRRQLPVKPEMGADGRPFDKQQWNEMAWNAMQSSLLPCKNCHRTFLPDRLEVHQRSCRPQFGPPVPPAARKKETTPLRRTGPRTADTPSPRSARVAENTTVLSETQSMIIPETHSPKIVKLPPAIPCYICGRMFGTKSVAIHEPQCLIKWRIQNDKMAAEHKRPEPEKPRAPSSNSAGTPRSAPNGVGSPRTWSLPCYLCGADVLTAQLDAHEEQCLTVWRGVNDALPLNKRQKEPAKPDMKFKVDQPEFDIYEQNWQSHLKQLVPCRRCARTFNPERVEVHERSCKVERC